MEQRRKTRTAFYDMCVSADGDGLFTTEIDDTRAAIMSSAAAADFNVGAASASDYSVFSQGSPAMQLDMDTGVVLDQAACPSTARRTLTVGLISKLYSGKDSRPGRGVEDVLLVASRCVVVFVLLLLLFCRVSPADRADPDTHASNNNNTQRCGVDTSPSVDMLSCFYPAVDTATKADQLLAASSCSLDGLVSAREVSRQPGTVAVAAVGAEIPGSAVGSVGEGAPRPNKHIRYTQSYRGLPFGAVESRPVSSLPRPAPPRWLWVFIFYFVVAAVWMGG